MDKCIYCGSSDIEKGVSVGQANSIRSMGLQYGMVAGIESLLADVCKKCGSVRLWVKNPNRDWA